MQTGGQRRWNCTVGRLMKINDGKYVAYMQHGNGGNGGGEQSDMTTADIQLYIT